MNGLDCCQNPKNLFLKNFVGPPNPTEHYLKDRTLTFFLHYYYKLHVKNQKKKDNQILRFQVVDRRTN